MKRHTRLGLIAITATFMGACGGTSLGNKLPSDDPASGSVGGTSTATSADSLTAQQSAQSADDSGGADAATAGNHPGATTRDYTRALGEGAAFDDTLAGLGGNASITGMSGLVNGAWVLNANVTFSSNPNAKRGVSGSETIVATWSNPNDPNRTLSVTSNLVETLADKDTVDITSLNPSDPTFYLNAVGRPADGNVVLVITTNEHRVRRTQNGNFVFDMNITTDPNAPLTITNSYAGQVPVLHTRTVNSGRLVVHHNLAKFTGTHTFDNLMRDVSSDCLCPQSGTITQVVTSDSGTGTYTRTYAFTGCGAATVTTTGSTLKGTANGSVNVTWNDCQN